MEDDLIKKWQSETNEASNISDEEIDVMLKSKSQSAINCVNNNLKKEFWISVIVYPVDILILAALGHWELAGVMAALLIFLIVFFSRMTRKIKKCDSRNHTMIDYIKEYYSILKEFVSHYKLFIIIIVPLTFIIVLALISSIENKAFDLSKFTEPKVIILLGISIIILYIFSLWLLEYMYGKNLKRLRSIIDDFESEEG
ncbi:MAG TPA: hypothetical protein ACFCUD_01525 [Cyclobacteriaceae bacterium]